MIGNILTNQQDKILCQNKQLQMQGRQQKQLKNGHRLAEKSKYRNICNQIMHKLYKIL